MRPPIGLEFTIRFMCLKALLAVFAMSALPSLSSGASSVLDGLSPHPRLIATASDWERLQARIVAEPELAAFHARLIGEARTILPLSPMERVMTGRRLLSVTREVQRRVVLLAYAWRTTGVEDFVRRAEQEMLAATRFSDWNPRHFLDVAEATAGLALGYDWLHDALSEETRASVRKAILELGIRPGLDPAASHNGWHRVEGNWNQVCFGGLMLGALAIAEHAPEDSTRLLELAREGIRHGLQPYAPDGIYPEGTSYWAYGTVYEVMLVAALESALGTDWGVREATGFLRSAEVYLHKTGASGRSFNFSDNREKVNADPTILWFARESGREGLGWVARRAMLDAEAYPLDVEPNRLAILAALWWPEAGTRDALPDLPRDFHGDGKVPLVVFREAWGEPSAAYLATKGGSADVGHAHMDAGAFVYEVDGVRWAVDLGHQAYESLESKGIRLGSRGQDGQRWTVYRLNNFSHNTLTLGGRLHRVEGKGVVERFVSEGSRRLAILDLSPVFADQAGRVRRGFRMLPDRGMLVQDEIEGLAAGESVRWQMVTLATIELRGDTAILRQDGRTVTATLLSPPGAVFVTGPADPPANDHDAPNPGVSLLGIDLVSAGDTRASILVRLTPGEGSPADPPLLPLADW